MLALGIRLISFVSIKASAYNFSIQFLFVPLGFGAPEFQGIGVRLAFGRSPYLGFAKLGEADRFLGHGVNIYRFGSGRGQRKRGSGSILLAGWCCIKLYFVMAGYGAPAIELPPAPPAPPVASGEI